MDYTLDGLPVELLHLIASHDEEVYRTLALVGIRKFFVILTPSIMMDYRIKFGYSVQITNASIRWYVNGNFQDGDQLIVQEVDGSEWLVNEVLHRVDGPAIEWASGRKEWWVNGNLHRIDGPAIERSDGSKEWWVNGKLHRAGDKPAIEWASGRKEWWVNGLRHRMGGPAVEKSDGTKEWWINGYFAGFTGPM